MAQVGGVALRECVEKPTKDSWVAWVGSPTVRAASTGGLTAERSPLTTSSDSTAAASAGLLRLLDQLIISAGVRRIRFQDLRHACASLLLAQDVPPRVVMDVLGHSQFSITMNLYSHVMSTALREAADANDRALGRD